MTREMETHSGHSPVRFRAVGVSSRNSRSKRSGTSISGRVLRDVRPSSVSRQGQAVKIAARNPWTMGYLTMVAIVIAFLAGLRI